MCRSFADGFPNLFVKDATRIRNRHVGFLASFHNPGTIFEQISVIYQLPRMFIGSFTLVLPYFPTGTAERVRLPQRHRQQSWYQQCSSTHAAACHVAAITDMQLIQRREATPAAHAAPASRRQAQLSASHCVTSMQLVLAVYLCLHAASMDRAGGG